MIAALLLVALRTPARAAERLEPVPSVTLVSAPLSPSPALAQLRLDLAALQGPAAAAALPQAALPPQAFAALSAIAQAPTPANPAGAPVSAHGSPEAAAPTDALRRVALAQQVLGKFSPEGFSKLSAGQQQAAMADLWDHWKAHGLVAGASSSEATLRAFDELVSDGVNDRELTFANKSIFLGAGVLGYPLEDSLWLSRTRIRDAIDDNALRYPKGQRWHTDDGTPEFLGTTQEAQALLDAWGRAVEHGRQVLAQAARGDKRLPRSAEIRPEAAAGLAGIAEELERRGDRDALRYLRDDDPTFMAFLLDARKPGYYLYNGDGSAVARIMATDAARALGIRRLDHGGGATVPSTYFYRPGRVAERLGALVAAPASAETADVREKLRPYEGKARALAAALPARDGAAHGYDFVEAASLSASALTSPENQLSSYPKPKDSWSRYDLPITAKTVRELRAEGRRYGALDEARWRALLAVYDACPALAQAPAETSLRVVSQPHQTGGRLIAPERAPERGAGVQMLLLDRLAALEGSDRAGYEALLRFAGAALQAALDESGPKR